MAQVSYGTITITDTNDIERIYTVYAKSANNTTVPATAAANWKESISEAPGDGNYIWQRTVVQKSGTQEKTYSDPVCLTGEEGIDGRGITSITIKYGTSADWNTQPSSWYDNTPEYSSSTPNYWTQTTISYTSGNPTVKVTQDKALTQAIHDSVMANSLAQSANENANGAMGQAASNVNEVKRIWFLKNSSGTPSKPTSSTTIYNDNAANHWTTIRPTVTGYRYYYYCEQTTTGGGVKSWSDVYLDSSELSEYEIGAMKTRFQNFFYPGDSNYPGAYAVGKSSSDGLDITDVSTYGYNLRLTPTALSIGYNELKAIEIDGATPALNFYKPSKTSQGAQTARLDANGLVLSEGGIKAGDPNQSGFIYLSTEDYPLREFILTEDQTIDNTKTYYQFDSNSQTYINVEEPDVSEINTYYELTEAGIPINNYTPTKGDNNLGTISNPAWRQVIGTKFGVDNEGNLYASGANINGAITATSLTIQSNGNNYDGMAAINISGYDITIEIYNDENESDPDNYTYLIPHMYHNGENIDNTITDKTDFIWYRDDSSIGTAGAAVDGGIRAYRGSTYRVIYEFEDGAVGDSTTIQDRYLYPTEYITDITDAGIKVHPKEWITDSNYLQIDGNGIYVKNSNDIELAHFTGTNAQIGKTSSNNVFIDENSLNIRKGVDILASFTDTSVQVGKTSLSNVFIDENSLNIRKGADVLATFSATGVQIGKSGGTHSKMSNNSMIFYGATGDPVAYFTYITIPNTNTGSAFYTFGTRKSGALAGAWSFAAGEDISASGIDSHAEGYNTYAGNYSHAEGYNTQANGYYSHAQNNGTIASKSSQTAIGEFNIEDTENTRANIKAFIVGNGMDDNNRSNAFTVDFSGNVTASGEIMDGNGNTVSKAYCYVNSVTSTTIATASTNTQIPITSINSTNSFTYDSTTNGIKCNKSGRYLVSCGLYASTATSGDLMGVSVTKNDGASTCGPQYQRAGGNNETIMLMPTPIQLAEGDILTILGRNNTSARGTFTSCRFSVWEI